MLGLRFRMAEKTVTVTNSADHFDAREQYRTHWFVLRLEPPSVALFPHVNETSKVKNQETVVPFERLGRKAISKNYDRITKTGGGIKAMCGCGVGCRDDYRGGCRFG